MIKSINISNFRSIKDKTTLIFSKSERKKAELPNYTTISDSELACSTIIYGANASGKSNLLLAFKAMEYLVINSVKFDPDDTLSPYEPFRLDNYSNKENTEIELEFYINEIKYIYTIEYNRSEIISEKLIFYPVLKEALLFNRKQGEKIDFGDNFKGAKRAIEKLTLPNQLFLSKAAENNAKSILDVYNFFKNGIRIYPFINQYHEPGLEQFYAKRLANEPDSNFAKKLNALLCALDTGIDKITAKETDWESVVFPDSLPDSVKNKIQEDFKYEIKALHKKFDENNKNIGFSDFNIEEESVGTRSLLSLGGIIIDALEKGIVLIIDEFEKNLHPFITSYLISLFNNSFFNPKKAQLIFATHDTTKLDNELFNHDQIWFTEKDEFGVTKLIRSSDIKGLRLTTPLDKWYLSGRLGGTAVINDIDFIMATQVDEEGGG